MLRCDPCVHTRRGVVVTLALLVMPSLPIWWAVTSRPSTQAAPSPILTRLRAGKLPKPESHSRAPRPERVESWTGPPSCGCAEFDCKVSCPWTMFLCTPAPNLSPATPRPGSTSTSWNQTCLFRNLYREQGRYAMYFREGAVPNVSAAVNGVAFRAKYAQPYEWTVRVFASEDALSAHLSGPSSLRTGSERSLSSAPAPTEDHQGVQARLAGLQGCVIREAKPTVYLWSMYSHHIAHWLWDNLYPMHLALMRLGLQNQQFQVVSDITVDKASEGATPDIFSAVSAAVAGGLRGRVLPESAYDTLAVQAGRGPCVVHFDTLVAGVGHLGHMSQHPSLAMPGADVGAPLSLRRRLRALLDPRDLDRALRQRRERRRKGNFVVRVIHNKRFTRAEQKVLLSLDVHAVGGPGSSLEPLYWEDGEDILDDLYTVIETDVFIGSVGTANAYLPLYADQTAFVNIGSLIACNGTHAVDFMDEDWSSSSPHVRTLYVDPARRLREGQLTRSLVQPALDQALLAVKNGFGPVPLRDNLSPNSRVLLDLCALDARACARITHGRNRCRRHAWAGYIVHEMAGWALAGDDCGNWETPRANRTHLRALRARAGLVTAPGESDGRCSPQNAYGGAGEIFSRFL